MKGILNFVKTTIVGGFIFLIPFVILIMIVGKAFSILAALAKPLSALIPIKSFAGIAVLDLITVFFIILICFLAGLISKTVFARGLLQSIEEKILKKVPVYSFVKSLTESISGIRDKKTLRPVLLEFDDNSQLAFEVERVEEDNIVVYVPGSPNPWSGSVLFMKSERVKSLNIPFSEAIKLMGKFGQGANNLLHNH
jgi:uncharacterized membrane protein